MQWLRDAFGFPTAGENVRRRIITGGLMGVLGFFFIPAIVVYGYYARSIRAAASGDESPPAFDDWMALIYTGAETLVVGLVWILVTVGVLAIASVLLPDPSLQLPLAVVLGAAYLYLLPAPLALYSVTGDVRETFSVDNLRRVFGNRAYARAVFGSVIAAITAYLPVGVAVAIALLGGASEVVFALLFMVLPFATFWFQIVTAHLYGCAIAEVGIEPAATE